ncbi:MAG: hypothetical protein AMXMBFR53_08370 [Gemmatimonadota bacterium]
MKPRAPEPPGYVFEDRSVVRPAATRTVFEPLFRLVPAWLTANAITLLGLAATGGMLLLVLFGNRLPDGVTALLCLTALVGYAVADHLDGMQALASGTASPLGEFLDHFSDAVSGAFLAFAGLSLMPGVPSAAAYAAIVTYLLAFLATYEERALCSRLHFARIGALEGLLILGTFFLTSGFEAGRAFWQRPLVQGLPGYWIILAIAYAAFGGTVAVILGRMRRVPWELVLHAVASAAFAAAGVRAGVPGGIGALTGWAILTLHGMAYLARAMQPHLFDGRTRADRGSVVMAAALLATAIVAPGHAALLSVPAMAWVGWRAASATARVLGAYRDHWIWVNPDGR